MKHSSKLFSHKKSPCAAHTGGLISAEIFCLNIKFEISLCVVVGNILYNFGKSIVVLREFSVLYPVSNHIAENTTEVLMSCIRQEASGIGQHADETGKVSKGSKGGHLLLHTGLVVIEPPCAALLNLCNSGGILEASKDSTDGLIVVGIQAVQNGSGPSERRERSC